MKIHPMILMFFLMVSSCISIPTQQRVTATSEITTTHASTNTPLPTATPILTIDPNAPTEYSRFENSEYLLEKTTDNGNTLTYKWNKERKIWTRQLFTGYVWDLDQQTNSEGAGDQLFMTVKIDDSIKDEGVLPKYSHHENTDPKNTINWSGHFLDVMVSSMKQQGVLPSKSSPFEFAKWYLTHDYYFDFINADGHQRMGLWDGITVDVNIRGDFQNLKANSSTNGFSEAKSNHDYGPENSYMVKIWSEEGNLKIDIAPSLQDSSSWTDKQVMEMFMFGLAAVFEQSPDLTNPQSAGLLSSFVLNQDRFRLFDIEPFQ